MPIPLVCPGCSARISAPDAAAGKTVKCPKCKTPMTVPTPAAPDFEVVEDQPTPPPKKPDPAKSTTAARSRPAADDEDDRPRKKKAVEDDDDEDDRPRKKKASADDDDEADRPRKKKAVADEDDEDDRPRKSGKKRGKNVGTSPAILYGGIAGGVLLLCGLGFAVYWFAIREKPQDAVNAGGGSNDPTGGRGGGRAAVPAGWVPVAPPRAGFRAYLPVVPFGADQPPVIPPAGTKAPTIANYVCQSPDNKLQFEVLVFVFPDAVPAADREKAVEERMNAGLPKQFIKEVSRGKSTLGGKEATEVVEEVNLAGLMGDKPNPGGVKLPDRVVGVTRYCVVGNRAYLAGIARADTRTLDAEERGFFDNFELIPDAESAPPSKPDTVPPGPKPPPGGAKGITRNWKDFTAPEDYGFKARFPWYAPPATPNPWAPPPQGSTRADQFQVQYSEPGEVLTHFAVVVVRFKTGLAPADREKTLDDLVRLMRLPPELKPSVPKSVTWGGRPATEVVYEMTQPAANGRKTRIVMRRLITDAVAYVGFVREHGGVQAEDLSAFFDSFTLTR